jgi:hypothetical protein
MCECVNDKTCVGVVCCGLATRALARRSLLSHALSILFLWTAHLILYNNSLTGTIPTNWNLRNLFYLDLGFNDLMGTIPADWVTTMFDLRSLYLSNNRLTGSIPFDFASIGNSRLHSVVVNDNLLTGEIPGGFPLQTLDASIWHNNAFTSMDSSLCKNVVFDGGEMAVFRADCEVCTCKFLCDPGECVA